MIIKFIATIMLSLVTVNAFAGDVPNVFKENPRAQKAGLFVYLENQCEFNLRLLDPTLITPAITSKCLKAARGFVRALDLADRDHVSRAVVFHNDLVALLSRPKTKIILSAILSNADLLKFGIEMESIYDLVLRLEGSASGAIRFIGTIFQDTSESKYQIEWAMKRAEYDEPVFRENLDLAKEIIEKLDGSEYGRRIAQSFYPEMVRTIDDSTFYHLFVVARLSNLMRMQGNDTSVSFFFPFTFNYLYEAIQQKATPSQFVFSDVAFKTKGALDDIFLGYVGALWGSGVKKATSTRQEFHGIFKDNKASGSNFRALLRKTKLD